MGGRPGAGGYQRPNGTAAQPSGTARLTETRLRAHRLSGVAGVARSPDPSTVSHGKEVGCVDRVDQGARRVCETYSRRSDSAGPGNCGRDDQRRVERGFGRVAGEGGCPAPVWGAGTARLCQVPWSATGRVFGQNSRPARKGSLWQEQPQRQRNPGSPSLRITPPSWGAPS